MKDTGELIDTFVKKSESVYVPPGKTTWRLSTGILTLDKILGGGFPGGSIVQLYGLEKSGKTTLAYTIAGQAVKQGYSTLLIPLERYSEQYAEACGLDINADNLHIVAADYAELVFNLCIEAVRNYDTQVIVMDSISAATPKADIEKKQKTDDMDKGFNIGTQARSISDFIRKIQQPIRRKEAIFLAVNQLSYEISRWGGRKIPKGGLQLQYFSDVKINMWGKEYTKAAEPYIETILTVDKGKDWDIVPYGSTTLTVYHGRGIDTEADLLRVLEKAGIVERKGTWLSYKDYKVQGATNFCALVREEKKLRDELFNIAAKSEIEIDVNVPEEKKAEEEVKNGE